MAKISVNFGLDNSATFEAETISDVLSSARLQQFLGFSTNVEAVIDGVVRDYYYELKDGDIVTLRAKAGNKGAASVAVNYGLENSITLAATNVGEILSNDRAKQYLGYGDNVEAVVNNVVVGRDYNLMNGDVVNLRAKAGNKGAKALKAPAKKAPAKKAPAKKAPAKKMK
jgi:molybdopterin converting factor small subunit